MRHRRRGSPGRATADVSGQKSGLRVGHVHPNPPKNVHNEIRAIEPKNNKKVRLENYVRKHGFSLG